MKDQNPLSFIGRIRKMTILLSAVILTVVTSHASWTAFTPSDYAQDASHPGGSQVLTSSAWNRLIDNVLDLNSRIGWGGAKAWVNFNGTGCTPNCTIRASYNVSSVVRNSAGNYTVNFSTPLSNGNYVVASEPYVDATDGTIRQLWPISKTAGYVQIRHIYADAGGFRGGYDYDRLGITIFGN